MQIDIYTKAVLTVIAIGVGLLVFDQKPVKDAQAADVGLGGRYMLIAELGGRGGAWHMNGDKIRFCTSPLGVASLPGEQGIGTCSAWK